MISSRRRGAMIETFYTTSLINWCDSVVPWSYPKSRHVSRAYCSVYKRRGCATLNRKMCSIGPKFVRYRSQTGSSWMNDYSLVQYLCTFRMEGKGMGQEGWRWRREGRRTGVTSGFPMIWPGDLIAALVGWYSDSVLQLNCKIANSDCDSVNVSTKESTQTIRHFMRNCSARIDKKPSCR